MIALPEHKCLTAVNLILFLHHTSKQQAVLGPVATQLRIQLAARILQPVACHGVGRSLLHPFESDAQWQLTWGLTFINYEVCPWNSAETRAIQLAHEELVGGEHHIELCPLMHDLHAIMRTGVILVSGGHTC